MAKQEINEVISGIKADLKGNVKNVFSKLQICRVELAQMNLKKSGLNKHNKIPYYELKDFLPSIMQLFARHNLCSRFTDLGEFCELDVFDSENPENSINFKSKNVDSKVPGATAIQSQGALLTYQRRYLYFSALEIVEADYFDSADYGNDKNAKFDKCIDAGLVHSIEKQFLTIGANQAQQKFLLDKFGVQVIEALTESQFEAFQKGLEGLGKAIEKQKAQANG